MSFAARLRVVNCFQAEINAQPSATMQSSIRAKCYGRFPSGSPSAIQAVSKTAWTAAGPKGPVEPAKGTSALHTKMRERIGTSEWKS